MSLNLKLQLIQVGCKAVPRQIWSYHIFIHNISSYQNLKIHICKIHVNLCKIWWKIQKLTKCFLPPITYLRQSALSQYCSHQTSESRERHRKATIIEKKNDVERSNKEDYNMTPINIVQGERGPNSNTAIKSSQHFFQWL